MNGRTDRRAALGADLLWERTMMNNADICQAIINESDAEVVSRQQMSYDYLQTDFARRFFLFQFFIFLHFIILDVTCQTISRLSSAFKCTINRYHITSTEKGEGRVAGSSESPPDSPCCAHSFDNHSHHRRRAALGKLRCSSLQRAFTKLISPEAIRYHRSGAKCS